MATACQKSATTDDDLMDSCDNRRDTVSSSQSEAKETAPVDDPEDNTVPNEELDTMVLALRFSVQTMRLLGQPSHKLRKILTHGQTGRFSMVFDIALCPNSKRLFVADVKYVHIIDSGRECTVGGFKTKAKTVLGIAVISHDRIALTDLIRQCVLIYDTRGRLIRQFGSENTFQNTKEENRFTFPSGIAHYGGRLYIADTNKHRVSVWSKKGKFEYHIANELMKYPDRIVVKLNGDLLVRCSNQNGILVMDPDGVLKTNITRGGPVSLDTPSAMCLTEDDHLQVTGRSDQDLCVDLYDQNWGHVIRFVTNIGPDNVSGIAASCGRIYVGKRSEIYIF